METKSNLHILKTLTVIEPDLLAESLRKPHTFVVCGSSRGGTSAIAYAMIRAGIDLGKDLPLNLEDPEVLPHINDEELNEGAMSQIIAARSGRTWGFKVPDAAFHLPWFSERAENPIFVIILRSPLAVGNSIINREAAFTKDRSGFSVAFRHPLKFFNTIAAVLPRLRSPIVLLDYEGLHYRSSLFVDEFFGLLGITCDEKEDIARELSKSDYKHLPNLSRTEGFVDCLSESEIRGWARRLGDTSPLRIELVNDGVVLSSCIANLPREDLMNAGKGNCAFKTSSPSGVSVDSLKVRVAGTDTFLQHVRAK